MATLKRLPDVPCPWCSKSGGMRIDVVMVAKPVGSFSLAGEQLKVSAQELPLLLCELCLGSVRGVFDSRDPKRPFAVFPEQLSDPVPNAGVVDATPN